MDICGYIRNENIRNQNGVRGCPNIDFNFRNNLIAEFSGPGCTGDLPRGNGFRAVPRTRSAEAATPARPRARPPPALCELICHAMSCHVLAMSWPFLQKNNTEYVPNLTEILTNVFTFAKWSKN